MTRMMWVASGLAGAFAVLFVALYFGTGGKDSGDGGGGAAVKFDQKLADEGKQLSESNGCTSCHSVTGASGAGPTWKGIYGSEAELDNGQKVKVDDKFLTEAILNPPAQVRKGFGPSMPSYQGKLSDSDAKAIVEYIKSLNG